MEDKRLSFDEAYDVATMENIAKIHEHAMAENEIFDVTHGQED